MAPWDARRFDIRRDCLYKMDLDPFGWGPVHAPRRHIKIQNAFLQYSSMGYYLCQFQGCGSKSLGGVVFVCVELLRPRQPNGIMSSAVSLPNHTFTRQA